MAKTKKMTEVEIDSLILYDRNAKKHPPEQIEKLKKSIREFGFVSPILIDEKMNVIAGHGRIMAAKELGIEKVPAVFIEGLTDEQRRAYIIADNRLTELGGWDESVLLDELKQLSDIDFDISLTGFDEPDFSWKEQEENQPDDKYTPVVNIPQYEPSGNPVYLEECVDNNKYLSLIEEIKNSNVSDDEKSFLEMAASRHIVFSYKKIADYYASASPEMQRLMEKSALVIIDINDAIRYGYARLSSALDEIFDEELESSEKE